MPELKEQSGSTNKLMTRKESHEKNSCSIDVSVDVASSTTESDNDFTASNNSNEHSDSGETNNTANSKTSQKEKGFKSFGFSDALLNTLSKKGYEEPSPIQKASIPELMLGRDLVGQAQTGTGKTAAFALPLIERIKTSEKLPQVLVLAPTRELAMQVAESFKAYATGHPNLRILAVYGGADFRPQIHTLKKGVEIIVGTPGRVMDHMRQGTLNTSNLKSLVLDEADEMLRMGFIDDVEWILNQLPVERQLILFSATMPPEIRRLSKSYLNEPAEITIKVKSKEAQLIRQRYIVLQNSYKIEVLKRVLEAVSGEGVIIFARTKAITLTISEVLEASGYEVAVLNGDVPQNQRERTVDRLRNGGINVLVATDVAARGLDVDRIGLVINYDMPFDTEAYVHRIGRTGRAGRTGEAILFINQREKRFITNLERAVKQTIEQMEIPNNEFINKTRIEKLKERLTSSALNERTNEEETELLENMIESISIELKISPQKVALAAMSLAIGPAPLLSRENEDWIKRSTMRSRNGERRGDRAGSSRRMSNEFSRSNEKMEKFRVEVGYQDHVKPGNLVGAIANESGLKGRMIGRIQIFENHSFIDLPKGMPKDIFENLKKVKVMNKALKINRMI